MIDILHSIREAIELPTWAKLVALLFVAFSPLVVLKWRKGTTWHKGDK